MIDQKDQPKPQSEALLTVGEVAKALRVDSTTVRRWITQGVLDAVILPHVNERMAYRVKRSTLAHILSPESTQS